MAGHPTTRAARRSERDRTIKRRLRQIGGEPEFVRDPGSEPVRAGKLAKGRVNCTGRCGMCDRGTPDLAGWRWRWDRVLADGGTRETPRRREGMTARYSHYWGGTRP